jgi:hypothetical protein
MKKVFRRDLSMPYEHKYEIQTKWGDVERLFPVKELMQVVKVWLIKSRCRVLRPSCPFLR